MQALRVALVSSLFSLLISLLWPATADARSHIRVHTPDDEVDEISDPRPESRESREVAVTLVEREPLFRLEGGIGLRWGSFLINNVDTSNTVKQLHLDGGLRFATNRVFVYGQYALQSMQVPLDELAARSGTPLAIGDGRGLMHRFAAHGRYSFARVGASDGGIDLYADVGVGVQHIRWDAGGAWTRGDLQLALGLAVLGLGERRHGGLSTSIVLTLAPRSDVAGAGMACGGPCDYATTPTGFDRSFMFDVTLMFGK